MAHTPDARSAVRQNFPTCSFERERGHAGEHSRAATAFSISRALRFSRARDARIDTRRDAADSVTSERLREEDVPTTSMRKSRCRLKKACLWSTACGAVASWIWLGAWVCAVNRRLQGCVGSTLSVSPLGPRSPCGAAEASRPDASQRGSRAACRSTRAYTVRSCRAWCGRASPGCSGCRRRSPA